MPKNEIKRIHTISDFHRHKGIAQPEHPLISINNFDDIPLPKAGETEQLVLDFYSIALKRNPGARIKYGQQEYDFNDGLMFFIAPGQVFSIEHDGSPASKVSGWLLLVHPDFLWNSPLAKGIRQYEYFGYSANEALFLSGREEQTIVQIIHNTRREYLTNIDAFSQQIILSQLELLLNYADRFYHRQFITRKITNHKILEQFEELLNMYLDDGSTLSRGLPSVQYFAEALHISTNYLSSLLKVLTGQSTQQHIHEKLIQKAKEKLTTTQLTISEIAYELGFEHPQSFSKLFKSKTNSSPLEFRQSFH
ncbi:AraC family transcriptional regulator [Chitinophaga caeni]|uniref:AraC family transcriptional regulator n=1 Tax=Chitinophaga caeni TaxID=2029983 RepID=A0A291QZU4_9BACT|nr:helix-turn-helix transcriptional regulator [Chitinophaga caeni]ATL49364.1 AraC family transcriptional regulator [Chitinophaga caeni]